MAGEEEIIGVTKTTYERMLKLPEKVRGDAMLQYHFMVYTASWQCNSTPKCTPAFVAKALGTGLGRVKRAREALKSLGLIEPVRRKGKGGRITGHYVRVNFLPSIGSTPERMETDSRGSDSRGSADHPVESRTPNAVNSKGNAVNSKKCASPGEAGTSSSSFSTEAITVVREWNRRFNKQAQLTAQLDSAIRETIAEGREKGAEDSGALFDGIFADVKASPFLANGYGAEAAHLKGGANLHWLLAVDPKTGTRRVWDYCTPGGGNYCLTNEDHAKGF